MTTGFVRSKPLEPTNTNVPAVASPTASKKLSQAYNLKPSEQDSESDEDEYFLAAWKEDFMMHYNHDIKQHETRFTSTRL